MRLGVRARRREKVRDCEKGRERESVGLCMRERESERENEREHKSREEILNLFKK